MPPKADKPKPKKGKEPPKELCRCGANTYRAAPKGKKIPPPIEHNPGCSYQRVPCDKYPHLPKCANCEENPCAYCNGTNQWCLYCIDNKCMYVFKRDILGWEPGEEKPGTAGTGAGGSLNNTLGMGTAAPGMAAPNPIS